MTHVAWEVQQSYNITMFGNRLLDYTELNEYFLYRLWCADVFLFLLVTTTKMIPTMKAIEWDKENHRAWSLASGHEPISWVFRVLQGSIFSEFTVTHACEAIYSYYAPWTTVLLLSFPQLNGTGSQARLLPYVKWGQMGPNFVLKYLTWFYKSVLTTNNKCTFLVGLLVYRCHFWGQEVLGSNP